MLEKWVKTMANTRQKIKAKRRLFCLVSTSFIVVLEKQLTELKNDEAALKVNVEKLQDPDYIARYAREKYLYSKDGEFIIRIPE